MNMDMYTAAISNLYAVFDNDVQSTKFVSYLVMLKFTVMCHHCKASVYNSTRPIPVAGYFTASLVKFSINLL